MAERIADIRQTPLAGSERHLRPELLHWYILATIGGLVLAAIGIYFFVDTWNWQALRTVMGLILSIAGAAGGLLLFSVGLARCIRTLLK